MSTLISDSENYFCELKSIGAIRLQGEQADSYLQGQVSVNMELLTQTNALLACHCDFKGKMWNANYLVRHDHNIDFVVKHSALPPCLAELKKYGVFSKVELTDISDSISFLGLGGKQAKNNLLAIFPHLSDTHRSVVSSEFGWVLTISNDTQIRYLCALDKHSITTKEITAELVEVSESLWDAFDVLDGVPSIFESTSNEYVPQMFNMQALDAIDFNKGCYMGQEVVARTKYLGKNKRATYLVSAKHGFSNSSISASAGDLLEKAVGENWRRGGTIIHTSVYEGVLYALAVLSNDTQVGEILRLKDFPEVSLTVGKLPYTIDEEVEKK